ncbi:hypothetical protein CGK74_16250 [Thauera propionica]|uniref:Uncharacterized protein n=1 Tax=Thauera propionica TaxID=2019431 RepID=A0A235EV45_9RHOO|nr:hypothetical protein [Thauera propionica]OYD52889.1 hypothetical protein CGK74_16250 [Thauera propionica]
MHAAPHPRIAAIALMVGLSLTGAGLAEVRAARLIEHPWSGELEVFRSPAAPQPAHAVERTEPAAEVIDAHVQPVTEILARNMSAQAAPVRQADRNADNMSRPAEEMPVPEVTAVIVKVEDIRRKLAALSTTLAGESAALAQTKARLRAAGTGAPSVGEAAHPGADLLASAALPAEKLDTLRGGFIAPGGLRMSFGIERAVLINGVLQSTTHLRVEDLGNVTAKALAAGSTVAVIQNGMNNSLNVSLPATSLATIVQNSLDNQRIQTVTTINATINSAEMMRGMRMHQSMQEALNRASLMR